MAVDPSRILRVPLFAPLTDEQRAAVADKLEERHVEPGRHLTTEHGSGYFFFVIDTGAAEVSHDDGVVVASLGPGDYFGEAAIFETRRRTATVTTTTDTVVFAMFGADFAVLVEEIPELKADIDAALEARLP
jgi:CRP/FNR family transcriptional regulator, cyclic AMP receptor protein